jgi:hypothetical protein
LKKKPYGPIFKMVGDIGGAFDSIYQNYEGKPSLKKTRLHQGGGVAAMKLMVAQVFNLCPGGSYFLCRVGTAHHFLNSVAQASSL